MWFKKKKTESPTIEIVEPPHEHIWKDFPWYMETNYSGERRWAKYKIIEPYVCVTCGERKNIILEQEEWTNISSSERVKEYRRIKQIYKKYLKPRAVVEDMINNVLLVKDPSRLKMLEELRGIPHSGCGTSDDIVETDFQIKLEKGD